MPTTLQIQQTRTFRALIAYEAGENLQVKISENNLGYVPVVTESGSNILQVALQDTIHPDGVGFWLAWSAPACQFDNEVGAFVSPAYGENTINIQWRDSQAAAVAGGNIWLEISFAQ